MSSENLCVVLNNEKIQIPARQTSGSVGYDIFCPHSIVVTHGKVSEVNTGVSVEIPHGYGGFLKVRSHLAVEGVMLLGGVIDTDYRGPIKALLTCAEDHDILIGEGVRFIQLVLFKAGDFEVKSVKELHPSSRGQGGFGSTGK